MKYTKEITKEKIKSVENFIKSVCILSSVQPPTQSAKNEFLKKDLGQFSMTCYFLNAVIFEILIKIFYELGKNEVCLKTHDLYKLYQCLSKEDKEFIQKEYNCLKEKLETYLNEKLKNNKITYCDLNEALKLNGNIVRDFKYEMRIDEKKATFNNMLSISKTKNLIVPSCFCLSFFDKLLKKTSEKINEQVQSKNP